MWRDKSSGPRMQLFRFSFGLGCFAATIAVAPFQTLAGFHNHNSINALMLNGEINRSTDHFIEQELQHSNWTGPTANATEEALRHLEGVPLAVDIGPSKREVANLSLSVESWSSTNSRGSSSNSGSTTSTSSSSTSSSSSSGSNSSSGSRFRSSSDTTTDYSWNGDKPDRSTSQSWLVAHEEKQAANWEETPATSPTNGTVHSKWTETNSTGFHKENATDSLSDQLPSFLATAYKHEYSPTTAGNDGPRDPSELEHYIQAHLTHVLAYMVIGAAMILSAIVFCLAGCGACKVHLGPAYSHHGDDVIDYEADDEGSDLDEQGVVKQKISRRLYEYAHLVLASLFFFAHTGVEIAFGQFIFTFALLQHSEHFGLHKASFLTAAFWGSFTLGQALVAAAGCLSSTVKLINIHLVLSLAASVSLCVWGGEGPEFSLWVGTCALGLGFSGALPNYLSWLGQYIALTRKKLTILLIASALGGMVIPQLTGTLLTRLGDPMILIYVTFAGTALCTLMFLFMSISVFCHRQRRKREYTAIGDHDLCLDTDDDDEELELLNNATIKASFKYQPGETIGSK